VQKINKRHVQEFDLTILEVVEKVSAEEILNCIQEFYDGSPTSNLIWDVSLSNLSDLSIEDVSAFHKKAYSNSFVRKGGMTVLVSSSATNALLLKFIKSLSDTEGDSPVSVILAASQNEAINIIKKAS
jgi:hypothetical protein